MTEPLVRLYIWRWLLRCLADRRSGKINKTENVEIVMHCHLRPHDATPLVLRFNYDVHTKFEVGQPLFFFYSFLSLIPCVICWDLWPGDIDLHLYSLKLNVHRVSTVWYQTLCQILAKSNNPRLSYSAYINIWPKDLERMYCVSHVALLFGIIFTKFEL